MNSILTSFVCAAIIMYSFAMLFNYKTKLWWARLIIIIGMGLLNYIVWSAFYLWIENHQSWNGLGF